MFVLFALITIGLATVHQPGSGLATVVSAAATVAWAVVDCRVVLAARRERQPGGKMAA